jgi:hypothetical protein
MKYAGKNQTWPIGRRKKGSNAMSEHNNNEPINSNDAAELLTLRKLRDELLQTKHTQKARITELESQVIQLAEAKDVAQATVRAVVVDQPLKRMAAELNKELSELVLRELSEDYSFDATSDGSIVMTAKADGEPVQGNDGKPVAWERNALHEFLSGDGVAVKSERQRMFTHLLGVRVGSGGMNRKPTIRTVSQDEKKISTPAFGLR